jgi:hypothetical protein
MIKIKNKKNLLLIVASSWVFYLSDWRCTEPQTLNLENVSSNLPVLIRMWFIHGGYGKDILNWKSEEFLGRCERVWLTSLCHKTDYQWLVYRQVAHTEYKELLGLCFVSLMCPHYTVTCFEHEELLWSIS